MTEFHDLHNAWHERKHFQLGPIPTELPPTFLLPMTARFDPAVGEEVILVARDGCGAFLQLGGDPVGLKCGNAFFKTPYGPVGIELWGITCGDRLVWTFERFLHDAVLDREQIWLLMERQSHVHLYLLSPTDRVVGAYEYENHFRMSETVNQRRELLAGFPCADVALAKQYVYNLMPTEEMIRRCLKPG